ncbi:four helix bundle protein [candidate division KSB1 bacterium]|nr:four helix bundle protein [candidate division KSB1 bacterium]
MDDASDSTGANFVEGYYSGSLGEYLRFLNYSKRSLGELQERIRRALRKNLVSNDDYDAFDKLSMQTMYLIDRLRFSLENKRKEVGKKGGKRL